MASLTRSEITSSLRAVLEPLPFVRAMWEGGSAAWGRDDAYSDVDLQLLVDDDQVEAAIAVCDDTLARLSPIEIRFEVPQPTWHGHAQVFYRLADAGEYLLVDLAVMKRSSRDLFRERERHGERIILFDEHDEVGGEALDPARHRARLEGRLGVLRQTFPLFQCLARKERLRGNDVAALGFYQSHTLQPLLTLLRIRHCPDRFDFGPKYALFDLPEPVYREVRELSFVASVEELEEKQGRAERLFQDTLRALDEGSQA